MICYFDTSVGSLPKIATYQGFTSVSFGEINSPVIYWNSGNTNLVLNILINSISDLHLIALPVRRTCPGLVDHPK